MEDRMLLAVLALLLCISATVAVQTENGEPQSDSKRPINPCAECEALADRSIQYFTDYKFFIEFERDNITNPWMQAGIRSCDEFRWAYQCFEHCKENLEPGVGYSYPPRFDHLRIVLYKYCEPEWSPGKSCRMADTRICDRLHNKRNCGEHLENYKTCISDVLKASGQNCDGVCTPASRFYSTLIFQWELECKLTNSTDGRCGDYTNLFCFGELKDTDLSWGVFDEMDGDPLTSNLETFCPKLEAPLECLQETVDTWLMYFGFNMTQPCASVSPQVEEIKQLWSDTIAPLCSDRPEGMTYVQDLCGTMPMTERIPSTTPTEMPSTTRTGVPLTTTTQTPFTSPSDTAQTEQGGPQTDSYEYYYYYDNVPSPVNACAECEALADRSIQYFTDYKFFIEFERDNITNPWMQAGIRSCDELRWAYQCFEHCKENLEPGVSYSYPPRFDHLRIVIYKYCEPEWSPGKSCRMADTRICDRLHNKRNCGDHLENYKTCISDVLRESGQNCDGVCTPASRFYSTLIFQWELVCKLQNSADRRCGDYVNLFCFGEMKDTDLSWGVFDEMNADPLTSNLESFCPKLEAPLECLQETVDTWLMYFGFNLTQPCASVSHQVEEIKQLWNDTIAPLCSDRPEGMTYVQELCGTTPTTERVPSTTTTGVPSTTTTGIPLSTTRETPSTAPSDTAQTEQGGPQTGSYEYVYYYDEESSPVSCADTVISCSPLQFLCWLMVIIRAMIG